MKGRSLLIFLILCFALPAALFAKERCRCGYTCGDKCCGTVQTPCYGPKETDPSNEPKNQIDKKQKCGVGKTMAYLEESGTYECIKFSEAGAAATTKGEKGADYVGFGSLLN